MARNGRVQPGAGNGSEGDPCESRLERRTASLGWLEPCIELYSIRSLHSPDRMSGAVSVFARHRAAPLLSRLGAGLYVDPASFSFQRVGATEDTDYRHGRFLCGRGKLRFESQNFPVRVASPWLGSANKDRFKMVATVSCPTPSQGFGLQPLQRLFLHQPPTSRTGYVADRPRRSRRRLTDTVSRHPHSRTIGTSISL
jgi:hypothetical protein